MDGRTGFSPGRRGSDQCGVHGACSQSCMELLQGGRGSTQRGRSQGALAMSHSGSCPVGLEVGARVGAAVEHGGLGVGLHLAQDLAQLAFM